MNQNTEKVIWPLDELLRSRSCHFHAFLHVRVSSQSQKRNGNLRNRLKKLFKDVKKIDADNLTIVGQWHYVEKKACQLKDRPMLKAVIAKVLQHKAMNPDVKVLLLSDCRNRILRGRDYDGTPETDLLDEGQLEELRVIADGVILATVQHPDTLFGEIRSYEMQPAKESGKQYGRPRKKEKPIPGAKKERREILQPHAQKLQSRGLSLREISKRIRVPLSTICGWLKSL